MLQRKSNSAEKLILDHLYNLRGTRMDPPDTRLSVKGIADALGLREREARRHLVRLSEMAYVRPFRVRNEAYYTLTLFSIQEIKSMQEKSIETEVSTSRVGFLLRRSKKTGLLK